MGLIITTVSSSVLLEADARKRTLGCPSRVCDFVKHDRATVQFVLQLLSNGLAMIQMSTLCSLINWATRAHWASNPASLSMTRFWNSLCLRYIDCRLPLRLLLPCLAFVVLTAMPVAIWVGAVTPIASAVISADTLSIPAYYNASQIRDWRIEGDEQPSIVSNEHGLFSYSVGIHMQASLMNSASSSSTTDGQTRRHRKYDTSRFEYIGRSYGVGATVGVEDKHLQNEWSQGYDYHETNFYTTVKCAYNASSDYQLHSTNDSTIYMASGNLPNSGNHGPEESAYLGLGPDAIVGIGVTGNDEDSRRILAFAAGKNYAYLNNIQCTFTFNPTLFRVVVDLRDNSVTVTPLYPIREFFLGAANLTHSLVRQFSIIAKLQTSLHVSALGNAFNQSITDYVQNSRAHGNRRPAYSFDAATLPGVETALLAMADDMLVAYSGAQMYIQQDSKQVSVTVSQTAYRIGAKTYIYLIGITNAIVILCFLAECIRTRNWKDLPALGYLDPAAMLVASA
ncbi:hypothetical protein EK21DRAFT_13746, partial [Setomelanomma holmii]